MRNCECECQNDIVLEFEEDEEILGELVISFVAGDGGGLEPYTGPYVVTPKPHDEVVLETNGKRMTGDVTVLEIPYWETSNTSGLTVYIGGD